MNIQGSGKALTIYISEGEKWHHQPLYVAIVEKAREQGLAGATVFQGIMGFGAKSRIRTTHLLDLSTDLPVVIRLVDCPERIDAFLPVVVGMVGEGLVTIEELEITAYRHRES